MQQEKFKPEQMAKFLEAFPVALENIKDGSQFIFQKGKVTFSEMNKPREEFKIKGLLRDTLNDPKAFHDLVLIYILGKYIIEINKTENKFEDKEIFEVRFKNELSQCIIKKLI